MGEQLEQVQPGSSSPFPAPLVRSSPAAGRCRVTLPLSASWIRAPDGYSTNTALLTLEGSAVGADQEPAAPAARVVPNAIRAHRAGDEDRRLRAHSADVDAKGSLSLLRRGIAWPRGNGGHGEAGIPGLSSVQDYVEGRRGLRTASYWLI